jgi:hypothetical protein
MSIALPVEGGCMCEESRLKVSSPPIITMACHCKACQKMSASAFSLTAMFPMQGFEVVKGRPQIGALHGASQYFYCPKCLNWLYTAPAGSPFINVRSSVFDAPLWSTPFIESYISEKLPWATTTARHSFERYPSPHEYGKLTEEYAEWSARF